MQRDEIVLSAGDMLLRAKNSFDQDTILGNFSQSCYYTALSVESIVTRSESVFWWPRTHQ